jgi:hypothetical protein
MSDNWLSMSNFGGAVNVRCVTDADSRGLAKPRTLVGMWSQRSVVDYSLQRRATLQSLFNGGATVMDDVCDADPYLLRAAKFHGEQTERPCPICRKEKLTHVTYVYGDELGQYSGRIRQTAELEPMARDHGEFRVYVVEVCQGCSWNYLTTSYVLGDGVPRRPPRRQRTVEDEY